jgi:hypothetical protein
MRPFLSLDDRACCCIFKIVGVQVASRTDVIVQEQPLSQTDLEKIKHPEYVILESPCFVNVFLFTIVFFSVLEQWRDACSPA